MRAKGRLQWAPMPTSWRSTTRRSPTARHFSAMNRASEGVRHLVVSGHPLITDGVLDVAARPGQPVRRPVANEG